MQVYVSVTATSFNQPIGVGTRPQMTMYYMFGAATSSNRELIGSWDIVQGDEYNIVLFLLLNYHCRSDCTRPQFLSDKSLPGQQRFSGDEWYRFKLLQ